MKSIGEKSNATGRVINWILPICTVSEANRSGEHWTKKHKRHKMQQMLVFVQFNNAKPKIDLPCHVKLTRISPRKLDSDNLVTAFKHIRDEVAKQITGCRIAGVADSSDEISWEYAQRIGAPQSIQLEIFCEKN